MKRIRENNHTLAYLNLNRSLSIVMGIALTAFGPFAQAHDLEEDHGEEQADYANRLNRSRYLERHRMSEGVRQRAVTKLQRAGLEASGATPQDVARALLGGGPRFAFAFTAQPELKSIGDVNTLTVLIDFKDFRAGQDLPTRDGFEANIYGTGTPAAQAYQPMESVHSYYKRASEGLSNLQGTVLDWHHFSENRSEYEPDVASPGPNLEGRQMFLDNRALFKIAREALEAQDTHDFSQYDNDNDGDIDLVTILYAGPRGAWSSFWWAYRWEFQVPEASTVRFDGKRLKQFVFQFVDTRGGTNDFDPTTLMHEMGHAYGLPDYYDYDPTVGPQGGVGGLDMMHANMGNHCALSRWLLDWIKPEVIGNGAPTIKTLRASGASGCPSDVGPATNKAIAVFPNLSDTDAPTGEMFMVENRHQVGNDSGNSKMPGNGCVVWHVDATPNGSNTDFEFDNSFTSHKLIRLVRADSADDFAQSEPASAATYFNSGAQFSNSSIPASTSNAGVPSNVTLRNISAAGENMTVEIGIEETLGGGGPVLAAARALPNGVNPAPRALAPPPAPKESAASKLLAATTEATDQAIDFDVLEKLDQALASADSSEIAEIWKNQSGTAGSEMTTAQARQSQILILTRWASKDGLAAANALLSLKHPKFVEQAYPTVMQAWAANTPASAAEWYLSGAQKELRASKTLKAGATFGEKIFCCMNLEDPQNAISKLDSLSNLDEIYGALKGINASNNMLGIEKKAVDAGIEKLKVNKSLVLQTKKLIRLREEIEPELIKDLEQRKRFKSFLEKASPE